MKKTETLIGVVTLEQILAWEKQYKRIYSVEIDGHICYFKPVDRKTLSLIMTLSASNPLAGNEAIITNCWLGGSEEINTDEEMYCAVVLKVGEIINNKSAVLKKL